MSLSENDLIAWFHARGGILDPSVVGFSLFPDTGRGAVALQDIQEEQTLFTIPRKLLLSTRTSSLRAKLNDAEWKSLGSGWGSLILCMMWERAQGPASIWSSYLQVLPKSFDTPMFWGEEDLAHLEGTSIIEKLGQKEANEEYETRIVPLVKSRPDLFLPEHLDKHYTLTHFHYFGSNILSRSFHVEKWDGTHAEDTEEVCEIADTSVDSVGEISTQADVPNPPPAESDMDVDKPTEEEHGDSDDDDEEIEDTGDVSMVPIADMLNARHSRDNARLFYEEHTISMIATRRIAAGEQIWNTYGNPPNSDLLRRYGHVDLVPLPDGTDGNPSDVVEVNADLVVQAAGVATSKERIDWWLESGGDDVFVLDTEYDLPEGLVSLVRLLLMTPTEWSKAQQKSNIPKPKVDTNVLRVAVSSLQRRIALYPTSLEYDEKLLSDIGSDLSTNHKNAVVVRAGEKRILTRAIAQAEIQLLELEALERGAGKKRKAGQDANVNVNAKGGKGGAKRVRK